MKKLIYLFGENKLCKGYRRLHSLKHHELQTLDRSYQVEELDGNTVLMKRYVYKLIGFWEYPKTVKKLILLF
ncbi:hypothetical protein J2Z44_001844 [Clostridium punense]|uniref:Uncharacterized protein n=1 Tax=Clostridium punense TaxID=1054297 RepID=A0ABS4K2M9_9CLOT|nr:MULTISPECIES: hypothetical protein [Clostridium]EQB89924.1 hypothetical protein M918_18430 [Clostridium sp. BL8]MBP2022043.1 hypothetical protein [Clostridium punense]